MKTKVLLKNLFTEDDKNIILRNLGKIMDVRVVELDIETQILCFLCRSDKSFEEVKQELSRIGFPIDEVLIRQKNGKKRRATAYENWEPGFDK